MLKFIKHSHREKIPKHFMHVAEETHLHYFRDTVSDAGKPASFDIWDSFCIWRWCGLRPSGIIWGEPHSPFKEHQTVALGGSFLLLVSNDTKSDSRKCSRSAYQTYTYAEILAVASKMVGANSRTVQENLREIQGVRDGNWPTPNFQEVWFTHFEVH